jgi:hypothetical protein
MRPKLRLGLIFVALLALVLCAGMPARAWTVLGAGATDPSAYALAKNPVAIKSADATLTASECSGYLVKVTGAATVTLPAGVQGYNLIIYVPAAAAVSVKPAGSEAIVLNGTALAAAHKVTSTSTAGDSITMIHDGANWIVLGVAAWTDGGV